MFACRDVVFTFWKRQKKYINRNNPFLNLIMMFPFSKLNIADFLLTCVNFKKTVQIFKMYIRPCM